jgi:hypothetical protein
MGLQVRNTSVDGKVVPIPSGSASGECLGWCAYRAGATEEVNSRGERARPAHRALRAAQAAPSGSGVPDARIHERGRGRTPGGLAQGPGRGPREHPQHAGVADHRRREGLPEQTALSPITTTGEPPQRLACRRPGAVGPRHSTHHLDVTRAKMVSSSTCPRRPNPSSGRKRRSR